jgi:lipopolysaccharide assembly protein A
MKGQWGLIIGLVVALLITIFAVINMDAVTVNYMLGTAQWPLVIVIISSVLMGAILVGGVGLYQFYKLNSQLHKLKLENDELKRKSAVSKKLDEKAPESTNTSK